MSPNPKAEMKILSLNHFWRFCVIFGIYCGFIECLYIVAVEKNDKNKGLPI